MNFKVNEGVVFILHKIFRYRDRLNTDVFNHCSRILKYIAEEHWLYRLDSSAATENWLPHRTKRHGRLQLAGGTGARRGN